MFDGELRLAFGTSVTADIRRARAYPTPPRPTNAMRELDLHRWSICSRIVRRSTKSTSRPNGINIDGLGGVSGRSAQGRAVVSVDRFRVHFCLPGLTWNVVLTAPLMMPACKPELASLKDIAEAMIVMSE